MGLKVRLLCQNSDDPAALVTKDCVITGSHPAEESISLKKFLDDLDVVTFESEFIDPKSLALVLNKVSKQPKVFPSLDVMGEVRDRRTQKKMLADFAIPTAPLISFLNNQDLGAWLSKNKSGLVLKKRLFGYDGYGTVILKNKKDLENSILKFSGAFTPDEWICEEFCPFKREVAFSIARNEDGDFYTLPLVETVQSQSRCDYVKGPLPDKKLSKILLGFKKMMNQKKYVGLLSVELFETSKGLIVNELAPRVHNSAHYSIEALQVSQFEAHLRAILNWDLPKQAVLSTKGFAMANLIGQGSNTPSFSSKPSGHLHWYGKTENRAGRKMGHLTVLAPSADKALRQALNWRKYFKL